MSNYSRDASLGYPSNASKRAFYANKNFDIIYLKSAIEMNVPLAHLESLVDDLERHKESTFDDACREEMKK